MIRDFVSLSFQNARHRKLRSWLTIIGIIIGIAAIVSLITISKGLEEAITSQFNKMGTNRLMVTPKESNFLSLGQDLTTDDVKVLEKISELKWITPYLIENANIEFGKEKHFRQVTANTVDDIAGRWADIDFRVGEGRLWNQEEKYSAIIGTKVAEDMFDRKIRVNNNIKINGQKFKIIGIFEEFGDPESDNMLHIPIDAARDLFDKEKGVSLIELVVKDGVDLEDAAKKVKKILKKARNNENFEVNTPQQLLEQLGTLLNVVQIVFISIAAISLVVGGIGIMNSMFTSVLEKRRDIGVMKSIGATNKQVMLLFLIEAGLFGLIGGFIGIILGSIAAYFVKIIASLFGFQLLRISVDIDLIFFSMAFAVGIGMLSGFIPAYQAARLKPVEALRYER
ncbi:ABC transporter permease [Candidatus Woesearchaeota archaeon]|nr:ABC transporter permease [Candidatus Woesearchaeota archaeon]